MIFLSLKKEEKQSIVIFVSVSNYTMMILETGCNDDFRDRK